MRALYNIIINIHIIQMAFFYPLSTPLCPNLYSLISYTQPHLQKSTILFCRNQGLSVLFNKNDLEIFSLNTNTFVLDQPNSTKSKTECKTASKINKKERRQSKQDQNFGYRNQKKDRNVLSEILKGYIQFTLNSPKARKIIENLSKKMYLENGLFIFYQILNKHFPNKKSYVGIKLIKKLLRSDGISKETSKILGISLNYYLREIAPLHINYSVNKLTKKAKLNLFKKVRKLRISILQF